MWREGKCVLLVEDDPSLRDRLIDWLEPGYGRVAVACELGEACAWIHGDALIDLAIVDLALGSESEAVMRQLRTERPAVPIIVLRGLQDRELHGLADRFGARSADVHKGEGLDVLSAQIERAAAARYAAAVEHVASLLTPVVAWVFRAYAQGASTADIAAELGITTDTVQSHRKKIFRQLGVPVGQVLTLLRGWYPLFVGERSQRRRRTVGPTTAP